MHMYMECFKGGRGVHSCDQFHNDWDAQTIGPWICEFTMF